MKKVALRLQHVWTIRSKHNCVSWPNMLWPVDNHASAIAKGTDTLFQWSRSAECSTSQNRGRKQGLFCCCIYTLECTFFRNSLCENTNWKLFFFVRLFRFKTLVVRLSQTSNAKGFGTMSQITFMFVAPLSSNHRGFRRHWCLLLLLVLLENIFFIWYSPALITRDVLLMLAYRLWRWPKFGWTSRVCWEITTTRRWTWHNG